MTDLNSSKYKGSKEYFRVYSLLIQAAHFRGTVQYMQVSKILHIKKRGNHMSREVGQILGEISRNEVNYDRPMLSSVAIGTNGFPSRGFQECARELNAWNGQGDWKVFWQSERDKVYKVWRLDY
jgi:hypothetical protein